MKKIKRVKIYTVHHLCCGHCYRTTLGCTWSDVLRYKRVARLLGETIQFELDHYEEYEYTI